MYQLATVLGIVIMGVGFLLLVFRLVRMIMLAHCSPPYPQDDISYIWSESIPAYMTTYWILTGILVGLCITATSLFSPLKCDNGCDRSGRGTQMYSALLGASITGVGFCLAEWARDHHDSSKNPSSGIDITLFLVGACVLLTDLALGDCLSDCAGA